MQLRRGGSPHRSCLTFCPVRGRRSVTRLPPPETIEKRESKVDKLPAIRYNILKEIVICLRTIANPIRM